MITATVRTPAAAFAARLTKKAAVIAAARGEEIVRAARADPWRWRKAALLWPLF